MDTVVDSNVIAKLIIPEPDANEARRIVREIVVARGETLFAVNSALSEVTNTIWKLHHRALINEDEARVFLRELRRSPVRFLQASRLLRSALDKRSSWTIMRGSS